MPTKLVESIEATDPVSGVVAPVTVRTLRGHGAHPIFVLIGDKPAESDDPLIGSKCRNDASKLFHAFYTSLPGTTLDALVREYLMAWLGDKMGSAKLTPDQYDEVSAVLKMVESKLGL